MKTLVLKDSFGRRIEYLRLSVTDRCDLRCHYCMPKRFKNFAEPEHWLTFDEIERVVNAFSRLGLRRIRITGGEPLLRKNVSQLATKLASLSGIEDLSLSTNGTQLTKHAVALYKSGVRRLNVSLDTLNRNTYARITGRDVLEQVIEGLIHARDTGFSLIKINMVAMANQNENEIEGMLAFCIKHGFILRLIEAMPMGGMCQNTEYLDLQPVKKRLQKQFNLIDGVMPGGGPARYLRTQDGTISVGFITPMSQHFCETCNRVRLSVDGTLYLCLGQEDRFEFRPLLRGGASDDDLLEAVKTAIDLKPEKHEFRKSPQKIIRLMSTTGG